MARVRRLLVALLASLTLVAVALPPAAEGLTRKQAVAKAKRVLKVKKQKGRIVLFAYRKPLRARSRVGEAAAASKGRVKRLRKRAWVFWLDLSYNAKFAHPGKLLALDARTGKILLRRRTNWFPIANARLVPWLLTRRGYSGKRYKVFQRTGRRRRGRSSARAAAYPRVGKRTAQFSRDCLVTIGSFKEDQFKPDLKAMNGWADAVGLRRRNAVPSVRGLNDAVDASALNGCRDVFIYLDGHGAAPRPEDFPSGSPRRIQLGDTSVPAGSDDLEDATGDAGVMVNPAFVQLRNGRVVDRSNYIRPDDLIELFKRRSDLTFKLKVDSCFAGRFEEVFDKSSNLLVGEFSSRFNEASLSNVPGGETVTKLDPDTKEPVRKRGREVLITDSTDNPDGAGEFTNGDVHGLYEWAQTGPAGASLVDAIEESFTRGANDDFARRAGFTKPLIRRRQYFTTIHTFPVATFDPSDMNEFFITGQIRPPQGPRAAQTSSPVTAIRVTVPRTITNFICPSQLPSGSIAGGTITCSNGSIPVGGSYQMKLRTSPAPAAGMGGQVYLRQNGAFLGPFQMSGP